MVVDIGTVLWQSADWEVNVNAVVRTACALIG